MEAKREFMKRMGQLTTLYNNAKEASVLPSKISASIVEDSKIAENNSKSKDEDEKEVNQDEVTENSDVFLPSNELLAKINSTTLYIKATNLIKEAQNLSTKIERSETIPFKEGCDELKAEMKTREEIVQKLKKIYSRLNEISDK